MFDEYTDAVIDHFMSPRNVGTMIDADCEGRSGDPECGDSLTLYLKIEQNRIVKGLCDWGRYGWSFICNSFAKRRISGRNF